MPVLRDLYESLAEPRNLDAGELPFARFLEEQNLIEPDSGIPPAQPDWSKIEGRLLAEFSPTGWDAVREDGVYLGPGDGREGCWRYRYAAGATPCPGCLWRWAVRQFPPGVTDAADLRLSWPRRRPPVSWASAAGLKEGELEYRRAGKSWRARLLPHPNCPCGATRLERSWRSWTHPFTGPVRSLVEHFDSARQLWSVSLELPPVRASGAAAGRARARAAALGEAVERWGAWQRPGGCRPDAAPGAPPAYFTEKQWEHPDFPLRRRGRRLWAEARALGAGGERGKFWSGLIRLQPDPEEGDWAERLSHGLACSPVSIGAASRRGAWELLERDALALWWAHWCAGAGLEGLQRHAAPAGGWLWSWPAAWGRVYFALAGSDGKGAWGAAAGPRAARRAWNEALHNAGVLQRQERVALPKDCRSFEDHAQLAWWRRPPRWKELKGLAISPCAPAPALLWKACPVRFYARPLPSFWSRGLGWSVVRVLSPDLLPLPMDERCWPLGHARWPGLPRPHQPHPFC